MEYFFNPGMNDLIATTAQAALPQVFALTHHYSSRYGQNINPPTKKSKQKTSKIQVFYSFHILSNDTESIYLEYNSYICQYIFLCVKA